jgi:IS6 family transposase
MKRRSFCSPIAMTPTSAFAGHRFLPQLIDATRPWRHAVGDRWFVDEIYVKVSGRWRYVYRGVDREGRVIDVCLSPHRDLVAARRSFAAGLGVHGEPAQVVTDLAGPLERAIEELVPNPFHDTEWHANNRIECDHGQLKARLRPMRGRKRDRTASVAIRGHAFRQNLRRGHHERGLDVDAHLRVAAAFDERPPSRCRAP